MKRFKKLLAIPLFAPLLFSLPIRAEDKPACDEIRKELGSIRDKIDKVAAEIAKCNTLQCIEKHRKSLLNLSEKEDELMKKFEKLCL
ncbi:MAG: hypothetical protein Kow0090_21770 [Myxococcota bacterium]